jgi:hypothetical protein
MGAMGFDIVLIAVLVGGIALSAAYVRAEYLGWREHGAAERRREAALRELHAASLSEQQHALLLPSVVKLQAFGTGEAANPDSAAEFATGRRASPTHSSRTYPFADPRERVKDRA